jgi:hypothetical protein
MDLLAIVVIASLVVWLANALLWMLFETFASIVESFNV